LIFFYFKLVSNDLAFLNIEFVTVAYKSFIISSNSSGFSAFGAIPNVSSISK